MPPVESNEAPKEAEDKIRINNIDIKLNTAMAAEQLDSILASGETSYHFDAHVEMKKEDGGLIHLSLIHI